MTTLNRQKTVLITGGTGSFGGALIDYLLPKAGKIVVYSRDESKQHDMLVSRKGANISYIVGDIRDYDKLHKSMKGVDFVFHAAALKHVSTGENYPEEVIQTNILGTRNTLDAAEHQNVEKIIVLSSDKAAYPISAYGMSKALAEKLVVAHKGDTINVCLRYGNVLGSRGSVVPLFLHQIKSGIPVTITNPNMTRFVLTLAEAVSLSIECLLSGNQGDLFIMRPPACTTQTIVDALSLHFRRTIKQEVIGIRPGEKMHEVLLTGDEVQRSVEVVTTGVAYAKVSLRLFDDYHFTGHFPTEPEPFTSANTGQLTAKQLLDKLKDAGLLL